MNCTIVRAIALGRGRSDDEAVRRVRVAAASYAALFAILLAQALRGEALLAPGSATLALFLAWALLSATALWAKRVGSGPGRSTLVKV